MFVRRWLAAVFAVLLTVSAVSGVKAAGKTSPEEAAKFLTTLGNEAISILRSKGATLDQRENRLRELLGRSFDLKKIGRYVLGRAWKKATPEQRSEYQALFRENVLRTYARRIGGYAGQTLKVVNAAPMGKQDALVTTEIARPGGAPIKAGWRVRGGPGGHKILDVIVQGLSMITTQRSEYAAMVRSQGLSGLLEALRMQTTKFAARSS